VRRYKKVQHGDGAGAVAPPGKPPGKPPMSNRPGADKKGAAAAESTIEDEFEMFEAGAYTRPLLSST